MTKPDEKEEVEQTEATEEAKEELEETETREEVKKMPEDSLSNSQRMQLKIEKMQAEQTEEHILEEKKKIEAITCKHCGSKKIRPMGAPKNRKFGVKAEDYMKSPIEGLENWSKADNYECKDCNHITYVGISYSKPPEQNGSAVLMIQDQGFPWQEYNPSELSDDHIKAWVHEKAGEVVNNQSGLTLDDQKLMRALDLALNAK